MDSAVGVEVKTGESGALISTEEALDVTSAVLAAADPLAGKAEADVSEVAGAATGAAEGALGLTPSDCWRAWI